jgi:hypothetical protein
MKSKYADGTLQVRTDRGELLELMTYAEPRSGEGCSDRREWLRWARDDAGRWYSFSRFGDAVVESISGTWATIVEHKAKAV